MFFHRGGYASLTAFAADEIVLATIDISIGSVTISENNDGTLKITHSSFTDGFKNCAADTQIVITSNGVKTSNTVTVQSGSPNITLDNCSIQCSTASPFSIANGATVNLTLVGDNTLINGKSDHYGKAGLHVPRGAEVIISGEGSLYAFCEAAPAIGGNYEGENHGGKVTIYSGTVTATTNGQVAGIGGGYGGNGGEVNIYGGVVTATGDSGTGIGGGRDGNGGTVNIYGGTVIAISGSSGAGIGGGNGGSGGEVNIYGGTVTATNTDYGAGIGGGFYGNGGEVNISGGTVTATGDSGAGIGGGRNGDGVTVNISGGTVIATGLGGAGIGGGGGNGGSGGTINISGGTVTAKSYSGAGIGGGYSGNGGAVTITGGNIKATSTTGEVIGKGSGGSDSGTLTDGNGNTVSLQAITLDGLTVDSTAVTAFTDSNGTAYSYGLTDVRTLDTNKLYFWLPETPKTSTITAGSKYICNRNLTYHTAHSGEFTYTDKTDTTHDKLCSGCDYVHADNEAHSYTVNGGARCVCGKENPHTHNWEYTANGATITATCKNTDNYCTNTAGGSVTIIAPAPADLIYDSSQKKAKLDYSTDWQPTEKPTDDLIKYNDGADLTGVSGQDIVASITLGDATATVKYQIAKKTITTVPVTVTAPVADEEKQTAVAGGTGYTAEITWDCDTDKFGYNTEYTATVTLKIKDNNRKFASNLAVDGWNVEVSGEKTATLTRTYPATANAKLTGITEPEAKTLGRHYTNVADAIRELPATITYTAESGDVTVDIQWTCDNYDNGITKTNTFKWTVKDGELDNYDTNGIATTGTITVTNASTIAVNNSGIDKTVTYSGSPYDIAGMFTVDPNAGQASYTIVGGTGEGTLNGTVLTVTEVGTFEIKLTTAANGDYETGEATATLTVNPADSSGSDNSGSDNSGSDNSGSDNSGSGNSGSDNSNSDNSGSGSSSSGGSGTGGSGSSGSDSSSSGGSGTGGSGNGGSGSGNGSTTLPNTGDNSHMALWVALFLISGGAFIALASMAKRKGTISK